MQDFNFNKIQVNYPLPIPLEVSEIAHDIYDHDFLNQDLPSGSYIIDQSGFLLRGEDQEVVTGKDSEGKDKIEIVKSFSQFKFHGYFTMVISAFIKEEEDPKKLTSVSIQYTVKVTDDKVSTINLDTHIIYDASGIEEMREKAIASAKNKSNYFYNKYIFNTKIWHFLKINLLIKPVYYIKYFIDIFYSFLVRGYDIHN
jgi:hypothetical protein